ncbi:UNVERIFIED_CONTAM: hypothetical protein NCL1_00630 [Trichonephila clavipes]
MEPDRLWLAHHALHHRAGGGDGALDRPHGRHGRGLFRRLGRCGVDAADRHLPRLPAAYPRTGAGRRVGAGD